MFLVVHVCINIFTIRSIVVVIMFSSITSGISVNMFTIVIAVAIDIITIDIYIIIIIIIIIITGASRERRGCLSRGQLGHACSV